MMGLKKKKKKKEKWEGILWSNWFLIESIKNFNRI
jgi:hypothetical protein